jgi:hypothetical protein
MAIEPKAHVRRRAAIARLVRDSRAIPGPPGSSELAEGLVEQAINHGAVPPYRGPQQRPLLGHHVGRRLIRDIDLRGASAPAGDALRIILWHDPDTGP